MPRLPHGDQATFEQFLDAREAVRRASAVDPLSFAGVRPVITQDFGYLFDGLQRHAANLLPTSRQTRDALVRLGETMRDTGSGESGDGGVPAVYTYFGQFVDHDITFETRSADLPTVTAEDLTPLGLEEIPQKLQNGRTPTLNLDSLYGLPAPRDGDKMRLGRVTKLDGRGKPMLRPAEKDDDNDLPRRARHADDPLDRAALIGDPRNDENTIISQLQVAFLRAHNALVDQLQEHGQAGRLPFGQARRRLRQYYQAIILDDFLPRVADPQVVADTIERNVIFRVPEGYEDDDVALVMPLEFSVAAYRFGHSMVREDYDFNLNFNKSGEAGTFPATLELLFDFSALSGELGDSDTLPDNWIVEWERLVASGQSFDRARRIDTALVDPLLALPGQPGLGANLAVRNLLRGYLLRLPTGQAVAHALQEALSGQRAIPVLEPSQLEAAATSPDQLRALREGGFLERTPLWYYVLAEAAVLAGGERLGPLGSTIVAEVLVGLIRRSPHSVLRRKDHRPPDLPNGEPGPATLDELLRLGGVL